VLGETIKQLRRDRQMTLQNLADTTGLSVPFLSQLENDQANPTLSTLRKVAKALDASVFALLAQVEQSGGGAVKIEKARPRLSLTLPRMNSNLVFELLTVGFHSVRMQALRTELGPGVSTCDEPMAHGTWNDEEWSMILEGEIVLEVGQDRYQLTAGDCIHFHPALPHRYTNVGTTTASLVAVMSPPTY
jgi:transcriptional regulator with XRE-family HTH domain